MFAAPLLLAALLAPPESAAPPRDGAFAESPEVAGAPLTGTVRGPDGPAAGVTVTAVPLDGTGDFTPLPPVVSDADGHFRVPGVDPGKPLYVIAAAGAGADRLYGGATVPSASDRAGRPAEVTVLPAASVAVTVLRHDGVPAAGAVVEWWERPDASVFGGITGTFVAALGDPWPAADADGGLTLPDLPAGENISLLIDAPGSFPQTVKIAVPNMGATDGDAPAAATATLAEPGRVAVTLTAPEGVTPPADGYRLRGETARTDARIEKDVAATVAGNHAEITFPAGPGQFGGVLSHPDLVLTPTLFVTDVTAGETATVELTATEPAVFTGRFTDPDGDPLGDVEPTAEDPDRWRNPAVTVLAYSVLGAFASTDLGYGAGWQPADMPVDREPVGEDGRFRVTAPRAKVKLVASDYPGRTYPTVFAVDAAAGGRDLGDVTLHPLSEVTGTVVDAAGAPVPGAIVLPNGGEYDTRFDPVLADAEGRFALTPDVVPPAAAGGAHPLKLKAFAPLAALVGIAEVGLVKGEEPAAVTVALAPGEPPAVPEPIVPPETRRGDAFPLSADDPAPELAAAAGYAPDGTPADPVKLADLRGRWVLLDVRSAWCGNCRVEEPVLDAVAVGFGEKLTVVSVYDVSDTPEKVAAYLADRPGSGPIIRDADDGATVRAYGVEGFPTRVLIDPAGRVRTYAGLRSRELPTTLRSFLLNEPPAGAADDPPAADPAGTAGR